jgi:integrase
MGQSRKRIIGNGDIRYTAYYQDLRGRRRSAGTFASKRAADTAWRSAESLQEAGHPGDPRAGHQRFADYVAAAWLPNHIMEPTTRQSYRYNLDRHILPWFGPMKMADILPIHVREWVVDLIEQGVTPATIRHQKIILSAVFTTALNDFVIRLHPCRGVKTPTVPIKSFRILAPDEIGRLLLALPDDPTRLLVDTFIGTGLRWGEATELRPSDLDERTGILTVSRAVVELHPDDHPTGGRFLIKPYPKNKQSRRFRLDPCLVNAIVAYIDKHDLSSDDLLFPYAILADHAGQGPRRHVSATTSADLHLVTDRSPTNPGETPKKLGLTEPNANGRRYLHGSLSAYTAGTCRCQHCRTAFATYRATRRANGHDQPRAPRPAPITDGHLPRGWWRTQIWYPACHAARLNPRPRTHDLRHSHASWLLAGGADIEVVRQRLGHGCITTTGKYIHTLPTADDTALTALARTRNAHAPHQHLG